MSQDSWKRMGRRGRGKGGRVWIVQVIAKGEKDPMRETAAGSGGTHRPPGRVMIPAKIKKMAAGGKQRTGIHPLFGNRPVQPGSRHRRSGINVVISSYSYSNIYLLNRTIRSPCPRQTPPEITHNE